MTGFDLDWYVVTTLPANEERARLNMTARGLVCWVPKYSKVVRAARADAGQRRFVERVLFPGYVFVAFGRGATQWMAMRDVPGVFGVITEQGAPLCIPSMEVSTLMSCCLTGFFDQDQRRVGSKVQIVSGEFRDLVGRIVKAPDDDKATVMLTGFGHPTFQQISLDALLLAA